MSVRPASYRRDRANRSGLTSMELARREIRNRQAFLLKCEQETEADMATAMGPKGITLRCPAYHEDISPIDHDKLVRNWVNRVHRLKDAARTLSHRFEWNPKWRELGVFMMMLTVNRKAA
jgi:hypothetical protein